MLSFHEARSAIEVIACSEDMPAAAMSYLEEHARNSDDTYQQAFLDGLKVAEYALLIAPISKGVEAFVNAPKAPFEKDVRPSLAGVIKRIGSFVATEAKVELQRNLTHYKQARAFAAMRGQRSLDRAYGNAVGSVDIALEDGGQSSAESMLQHIMANARVIAEATPDMDNDELITRTRASHKLALAHPLVHLTDLAPTGRLLNEYITGMRSSEDLLKANARTGGVDLAVGLQHWETEPGITVASLAEDHEDVRIGCPFSFAVKDLRTGYYDAVLDAIVTHDRWQDVLL